MGKIPVWWYIIGIPASAGLDVNVRRLWNRILAQLKIAIVYSIFNKNRSSGTYCVVTLFKAKVISRVKLMWNISLPDFRIQFVTLFFPSFTQNSWTLFKTVSLKKLLKLDIKNRLPYLTAALRKSIKTKHILKHAYEKKSYHR